MYGQWEVGRPGRAVRGGITCEVFHAWMGLHVSRGLLLCINVNRRGGRQPLVLLQSDGLYGLLVLHVWGNAHVSSVVGMAWFASHAGAVHTLVDVRLNGGGLYGR